MTLARAVRSGGAVPHRQGIGPGARRGVNRARVSKSAPNKRVYIAISNTLSRK